MYDDYSPCSPASASPRSSILRHHYGQRASKASDIAQLLDPEYRRATHDDNTQIYVDHAGEAHDPDFRLFAPSPHHSKRIFSTAHAHFPRDDDDEDVEDEGVSLYSFRASFDSTRARPHLATHDSGYAAYEYVAPASPCAYEYTTSPIEDDDDEREPEPRRETNKLRRRRASEELERPELDMLGLSLTHTTDGEPRTEWTPFARHALRRQWHALCLRTQVAAFRARRRVQHVVKPKNG